jgi:tryptophan synthase alpha chain
LLEILESIRSRGRKALVPYLTAGIPEPAAWPAAITEIATQADVLEVGLPYSDPLIDGPVIAGASQRAIEAGVGPIDALDMTGEVSVAPPLVAMTYYNPIHQVGEEQFCKRAAAAGIEGLIVPDLPLEESASLRARVAEHGLAWIPLITPTSSRDRAAEIAATATGFVYAVSTLGVTGTRDELSERAAAVADTARAVTDLPVLVGIGISNSVQAVAAAEHADGVVVGSAVVELVLEKGPAAAADFLGTIRSGLDNAWPE